jgi:hypothetical protein
MRRPRRDRGNARRHRLARPEILGVQAVTGDLPACKAVDETAHKRGWTADVEVCIGRDAHFLEHVHAHTPHPVEIDSRPIGRLWRTVTNVAAASGQGLEELAHLCRKWMLAAVAGTVNPPNLSPSSLGGQSGSIASTGVAPMPALTRTTGRSPCRNVKLPRGALTSRISPARTRVST